MTFMKTNVLKQLTDAVHTVAGDKIVLLCDLKNKYSRELDMGFVFAHRAVIPFGSHKIKENCGSSKPSSEQFQRRY